MKKFLVLSAIVGLAGIGVGVTRQQGGQPAAAETAIEAPTSTTIPPAGAPAPTSSSTVAQKAAAKPATKVTTTIRPTAAGSSPTTVATALPTTTTTPLAPTTTTTIATVTPICTVTAANPTVHKGDSQTISVASNMPSTKTRLTIQYPKFDTGKPNPRLEYTLMTDVAGNLEKTFSVGETSTVPVAVSVQFYDAAGHVVQGCQTSFGSS